MSELNTLEEEAEKELIQYGVWAGIPGNREMGYPRPNKYQASNDGRLDLFLTDERAREIDAIFSRAGVLARDPKHHEALERWLIDRWTFELIGKKTLKCSKNHARGVVYRRFEKVAGMIMESYFYENSQHIRVGQK